MISIVTPSFRQLDWLRLAMASVADQEGIEVEHIIQDGGSEPKALASIVTSPIAHLFSEPDAGMYDAINRGLRRARGDICGYLNCDEQYLPGALAQVTKFFSAHPKVDVLFGDVILVDRQGQPLSYRRIVLPAQSHLQLAHLNTASCATFFRRNLLDRGFHFDPQWKAIGDLVWIESLLQAGVRMRTLHRPLAAFTFTGENLGATSLSVVEASRRRGAPAFGRARTAASVLLHRVRKALAGAYRHRRVEIALYIHEFPRERQRRIAENVGFGWPQT
jgi:glycosyltransferase involved in cell wall biosynthesis